MKTIRQHFAWVALAAILVVFAACRGESPTAPPTGGQPGGGTPPSGSTVTLTVTNADPLIDSSVTITATVKLNGQPVANGTAVEFESTAGLLDGSTTLATIKTTTNGVATVTLTNSTAGLVQVRATVNNVSQTVNVTFHETPVNPPPPSTAPTITSIDPKVGSPAGSQTIRITGTNFRSAVKVLFDIGRPSPVEAFVSTVTETQIQAVTPSVDVGAGQQIVADIIVITEAGSANEQRVVSSGAFTFQNEVLTPHISTLSPNSGPVTGGTTVTIFGDGFQAPVQVLFGSAEARVIDTKFAQISVEAPAGRDTSPDGSGAVTGPVDVTVRNINSQTSVTSTGAFRYVNKVQITAMGPTEGIFTGGTRVTIEGTGFVAPVAVVIGGVAAAPISVNGTQIIAITSGVVITECDDQTGPTSVTNIANGDQAPGPDFTYRVPKPLIIAVSDSNGPPLLPGEGIDVTVANAIPGANRIKVGDSTAFITLSTFNPDGSAVFHAVLPTLFEFTTRSCTVGGVTGTQFVPLVADVTYLNVQTTCEDTAEKALTITPPDSSCQLPPPPEVTLTSPPPPACADAGDVDDVDPATGTTSITFANVGGQPLTVVRTSITGANAGDFTVAPSGLTIDPGSSGTFTVTFNPSAVGARSATVNFTTNDADEGSINVCLQGNGT